MLKTGALTKELMSKAVHHIAEEIVAVNQDWMVIPLKDLQRNLLMKAKKHSSTNVTSGSKSSVECEASNPTKMRDVTDNNSSHKWRKLNTSAVDKGSEKKKKKQPKKISDIIREYSADSNAVGRPKDSSDEATRELSECIE
jgi:3-dehydroquinate synthase class II